MEEAGSFISFSSSFEGSILDDFKIIDLFLVCSGLWVTLGMELVVGHKTLRSSCFILDEGSTASLMVLCGT